MTLSIKPPAEDWYENNLLCCPVSARHPEGGWFHLIYTKPKNAVGMGFARSKEGLAPVLQAPVLTHGVPCNFYDDHPDYAKGLELGGITRLGDRWFMIGGSRQGDIIVSATKPEGPYSPTPLNHSLPRGPEVFPRIYNDVPGGPLVTHTLKTTGPGGARYTTEPLKKLVREGDSVWFKWWPGNEKLKSSPVDLVIQDNHFTLPADPDSCIVFEAQVALDGISPETNWARTAKVSATQEYRFGPPAIKAEHYLGAEHVIDGRNERGWMGDYLGVHHHMRLGKEAFLAALQKRDQPSVLNLDLGQVRPIGCIVATWTLAGGGQARDYQTRILAETSEDGIHMQKIPTAARLTGSAIVWEGLSIKARHLRLTLPPLNLITTLPAYDPATLGNVFSVGLAEVEMYEKPRRSLDSTPSLPGLVFENEGPFDDVILIEPAGIIHVGQRNKQSPRDFVPKEQRNLDRAFPSQITLRMIRRGQVFELYADDYFVGIYQGARRSTGKTSLLPGSRIQQLRAWKAQPIE